ncbi:hypothetical protein N657DRAFT_624943 [Parathielavia appendiculata]|uniref:DUF7136 domain-containing protein n=1 Tax=Parathielavia appendiculata TaxID=2587402 RepID=A0AAN6TUG2_9PEZI|nr:hypothetical protein N657DRAFT_624943 [Parathielavia appendiculata]
MHFFFWTAWAVVGFFALLGLMVDAAGILEIDQAFPRPNGNYAPTSSMPIIFAFRNAELARFLNPSIVYYILDLNETGSGRGMSSHAHHLTWKTNWSSSEPYFAYTFFGNFTKESSWKLSADIFWQSCDENDFGPGRNNIHTNGSSWNVEFQTSNEGQKVDLVAATANDTACPKEIGVAINVTDTTMKVPPGMSWNGQANGTCVVVASSTPTQTANPCLVKIDAAAAASMTAARLCHSLYPPSNCTSENTGQRLAVASLACFTAGLGALLSISYLLGLDGL